jgi:hypothetical protein
VENIEMWEQFALAGRRLQPLNGASAMLATWMTQNKSLLKPQDLAVLLAIGGALYSAESEEVWKGVTA